VSPAVRGGRGGGGGGEASVGSSAEAVRKGREAFPSACVASSFAVALAMIEEEGKGDDEVEDELEGGMLSRLGFPLFFVSPIGAGGTSETSCRVDAETHPSSSS